MQGRSLGKNRRRGWRTSGVRERERGTRSFDDERGESFVAGTCSLPKEIVTRPWGRERSPTRLAPIAGVAARVARTILASIIATRRVALGPSRWGARRRSARGDAQRRELGASARERERVTSSRLARSAATCDPPPPSLSAFSVSNGGLYGDFCVRECVSLRTRQ